MMNKVLVTGAAGALGRAVVARLRAGGHTVLSAGRAPVHDVRIDLYQPAASAAALADAGADCILHLAASFGNELDEAIAINVAAPRALLDALLARGSATRVLLIGSAAEYGVVEPEQNPLREDCVLRPVSVYGMTKAWQTQLASLYAARGADVAVARVFNLDGPGLSERLFAGRLQRQIELVLAGQQSIIELGPLGATRDYLSTADAAEQLLAIAARAPAGSVHHVASGTGVTMREFMLAKLATAGLDAAIVREAPALSNRSGYDVPRIYADISRTRALMEQWRNK